MRRWRTRLALLGALGGIAAVFFVRRNRVEFDPARPTHAWGTMPLTIDEDEQVARRA